jgi:HEAT repeat protein
LKKSVQELIEIVRKSDDISYRREALIELGYRKEESIYPILIEQLEDPSNSIKHAAVISLGRYGNPAAIEELVKPKVFQSRVENIRWAAVGAIGKLGDYRVIEHLVKAVGDPQWIVRNQAVTEIKSKIVEIIKLKDNRIVRILVRLLAMEDDEIVDLAVDGLSEMGEESYDRILEAVKSPSARMRANAARVLGKMRAVPAVDTLIGLLHDPEWQVRRYGVEALGSIKDKRAIEPLVLRLADNVERVQRQTVQSLVIFGKLATEPLLNALAHEKNKFVLRALLRTLGEIGDLKAVPALISHLKSSYFVVRIAAVHALVKYGPQIIDDLLPVLSFNESNIQSLLKDAANKKQPQLQLRAIKALGGLEDHRAVNALKKLVDQGEVRYQEAASHALFQIGCAAWGRCSGLIVLREIGNQSLIPHFVHALKDDSDNVRLEAVKALAEVNGPKSIDPLIAVAKKDRDPYVRFEAVRQLRRVGVGYPQVLDLALSALKDPNRDVRSQSAWLLGNFQNNRSIQPLLDAMADNHWSVRESAEHALMNFGKQAIPHLLNALKSDSWTTRFRAARMLGEIGDSKAIEALESLLKKKEERREVRKVVQEALNKLVGQRAA